MLKPFLAVALTVATSGALAQQNQMKTPDRLSNLKVMTITKGDCPVFTLKGESKPPDCEVIVYSFFTNGRVGWTVMRGDHALTISGMRDAQPVPEQYRIYIDTIRIGRASRGVSQTKSYSASGQCDSLMSTDGKYLRWVSCEVDTHSHGPVRVRFEGSGPTDVQQFP